MWGKNYFFVGFVLILILILSMTGCQLLKAKGPSGLVLYFPLDQATGVQIPVTLSWSACDGESPIRYTVYLDTNPNPTTVLAGAQSVLNTSAVAAGLQAGVTYYWKVKAQNSQSEILSGIRRFTVSGTVPSAPELASPVNGSQVLSDEVLLEWNASSGSEPVVYDVYFGNAPGGLSLAGQNLSATSFIRSNLTNGAYYWRIVAKNAFGETESTVFSFTVLISASEPPSAPILLYPGDNTPVEIQPITLQWAASSGDVPITYDVYFDTIETPVTISASNIETTNLLLSVIPTGTYYWKVSAKNGSGQASSEVWVFQMTTTESATLTAPVLLAPEDGEAVTQNAVTLQWLASSGATPITYDVYFDQNPFPVTLVGSDLANTEQAVSGLTDGMYFWRVVGKNALGIVESSVASFTVSIPVSAAVVFLEKIDEKSFKLCSNQSFALSSSVSMTFSTQIPFESDYFLPRGMIEGLVPNPIVPSPNVGSSVEVIYSNVNAYLNGSPLSLSSGDLTIATVTFLNPPTGSVQIVDFNNGEESVSIGATDTVTFSSTVTQGIYLEKLPDDTGFRIKTVAPILLGTTVNMKLTATLDPALDSSEFSPNGAISGLVPNPIVSLPDIVYSNQAADLNGTILYTGGSDLTIATVTFASSKTGSVYLTEILNDGVSVPISSLNQLLVF